MAGMPPAGSGPWNGRMPEMSPSLPWAPMPLRKTLSTADGWKEAVGNSEGMHYVPGPFLKKQHRNSLEKGRGYPLSFSYIRMTYRATLRTENGGTTGYNSYKDRSFFCEACGLHMERRKIMISFILCLLLLTILFGIAYKITGAILKACVWLLILLPIGLILSGVGVIFCCTIILIPVGIGIIKAGIRMILPG